MYWAAGMAPISAKPAKATIWKRPNVGMLAMAGKPMPSLRMSENCTEPSRLMEPGKVMPSSWTIMPRNAIMEMRPCLISTRRGGREALLVLPERAGGSIGPGSTPMSPLTTTLEAACWPGATKAAGRAARRGESELGHFDCLRREKSVGAPRVGCWSLFAARERLRGRARRFFAAVASWIWLATGAHGPARANFRA